MVAGPYFSPDAREIRADVVSSLIDNEGPVRCYLLSGFEQKLRASIG